MEEEKKTNIYVLAFDEEECTTDFMKGLLTGLSDSVVTEFKSPWKGLIFVKSPLSADELSKCINKKTSDISHVITEISDNRQGLLGYVLLDFFKEASNKSSEGKE